jgi:hypothetical protein
MKTLICPTCNHEFACHRLAWEQPCPDMSRKCECDTCDPSRNKDGDCHTVMRNTKPVNAKEVVIFS